MNIDDVVTQLTAELRALKIRVAQLEAAATPNQDNEERSATVEAADEHRSSSGQANEQRGTVSADEQRGTVPFFQRGDRVKIRNIVRKPATWHGDNEWIPELAQLATVTHNYKGQVHFVTDNGVKTWRASSE